MSVYLTHDTADDLAEMIKRAAGIRCTTDPAEALATHDSGDRVCLLTPEEVKFETAHHYTATFSAHVLPGRVGDDLGQAWRVIDQLGMAIHSRAIPFTSCRYAQMEIAGASVPCLIATIETDHDIRR